MEEKREIRVKISDEIIFSEEEIRKIAIATKNEIIGKISSFKKCNEMEEKREIRVEIPREKREVNNSRHEIKAEIPTDIRLKKKQFSEVYLVSALTMYEYIDPKSDRILQEEARIEHPTGILSLAAVLIEKGITPHVIDLNKLFIYFQKCSKDEKLSGFLTFILKHIKSTSIDILALSTICSSYPLTLQIAQEVKISNPNVKIILGGPQASVVDVPTMEAFPFVDFIVRGEAEETFPLLLEAICTDSLTDLVNISGITFRKGTEIIRNPNALPLLDLDSLPLPAYYFDLSEYKIGLEIGRGCPFNCTFCSTSEFFDRKFRLKSPQKTIEQMKFIKTRYGNISINLIHDNFTANRKKVVEFCEALLNCGEDFLWTCSGRTDEVDDELIALMAKAGCKGIFFGIETGSARLQQVINKKLNLSDAVKRIECADRHGISTVVSFIIAFPEETKDDLRGTVNLFVDMFRFNNVEPRIFLLSPFAGTKIYSNYKDKLVLDHIYSIMSYQGWKQDPDYFEMIKDNPDIFPNFYSIPPLYLDRLYFQEIESFLNNLLFWFHWLPLGLLQDSEDMLKIFDKWRTWCIEMFLENSNFDANTISYPYYYQRRFFNDFIEFVKTYYINEISTAKRVVSAIIEIEQFFYAQPSDQANESHEMQDVLNPIFFPYKPKGLRVLQLDVDYNELIQSLRDKKNLEQVSASNVMIVFRETNRIGFDNYVLILSRLSKELLNACDGNHTVNDIVNQYSSLESPVDGIPSEKVCYFGLSQLFKQRLIEVSSQLIKPT